MPDMKFKEFKKKEGKKPDRGPIFKDQIKMQLRYLDEQQAVNRYVWYNLPDGLDGQLIERILYYKGLGMFFWLDDTDDGMGTFYFLPRALDGTIDVYGRYNTVTPLPFNGTALSKDDAWITGLTREVIKQFPLKVDDSLLQDSCVLLYDTIQQISQTNIPRQILNDPLIDYMCEMLPLSRTNLIANAGIKGLRVPDATAAWSVKDFNAQLQDAALNGDPLVAITREMPIDDLDVGTGNASNIYMQMFQTLDNYRLSLYGLKQGGVFDKSQYVNNAQAAIQQANVGLVYQDGLTIRQNFCDFVNRAFGDMLLKKTGRYIWCMPSETVTGTDNNRDGLIADNFDLSGASEGMLEVNND